MNGAELKDVSRHVDGWMEVTDVLRKAMILGGVERMWWRRGCHSDGSD